MTTNKTTPKELWARQQISGPDMEQEKNIRASVLTNESELYFYS